VKMQYSWILFILFLVRASSWNYPYNVSEWGASAEICQNGKKQSPIDLLKHPGVRKSEINTTLGLTSTLTASRKHSLKWSLNTTNYPTLYLHGLKYKLLQWHCHTGSEHTVDGHQYPGECHFVHYVNESGGGYAVIGVFLNDSAKIPNSAFSKLLDDLPTTDDWEEQELDITFAWNEVIDGISLEYYWSYIGSFTTPNCGEDVQWTVLRDVVEVTPSQIEKIEKTSGFDNNFRPPMPLYGRVVEDGSDIVNSSVRWDVTVCCIKFMDVSEITSSVSTVLGLLAEDLEVISVNPSGDKSYDIEYVITVTENTQTFLTYLLQNLRDEKFMDGIKSQIQADSKIIVVSTFISVSAYIEGSSYQYPYNVTEWGAIAPICEFGTMQSPIDLPAHRGLSQSKLNTTLGLTSTLTASRGHGLKWSLNTVNYPTFYVHGLKYELIQWHCHTGSEHFVEGHQYPAECHFVHYFKRDSGSEYAVIGVFLNDSAKISNSAFSKLLDDLPATAEWEKQQLNINFAWNEIISGINLEYYWSYSGSFTTPGCDEGVQWTVLRDVVEVTPSQIKQIEKSSGFDNNFRPPMPLYGRVVEDGSDIINSSVRWVVTVCCIKPEDVTEMTSSVTTVLGLLAEDLKIISFSVNGDSSYDVEYVITVTENTKSFLTYLLQNLREEEFMDAIKAKIEADSKIVAVSTFHSKSSYVESGSSYRYPYNVTEWGAVAEICELGTMQSPIDLPKHPGLKQSEINTTLGLTYNLTASRGHGLKWSLNTDNYPILYINGLKYELVQWHCHTGSEHTVDGYQYPGECHFVHYFARDSGSEYAVIGVFLDDGTTKANSAFSELLKYLPDGDDWEEQVLNINFDWSTVISDVNLEYYWSYKGSFTTPGCDEGVEWTVLRDVVEVTPFQIEQIEKISGFDNNFRPPMPLHGRVVDDGSNRVNSTIIWSVAACCIEERDVLKKITTSVGIVIGLSEEDIRTISFETNDDNAWNIQYEITIIDNTQSFLTYLLRNLKDEEFIENIKVQIQADLKAVTLSTFDSVTVAVPYTGSGRNHHVEAVIVCLFSIIFISLVVAAVKMKMTKMKRAGASQFVGKMFSSSSLRELPGGPVDSRDL
jgi:carbonic anhydrase